MFHQKHISRETSRANPSLTIITPSHPHKTPAEEVLSDAQINTLIKFERRTVKKEKNVWFADSDLTRHSLVLGLFLHLSLYISSDNYDEFDDYTGNLWITSITTRKLLLTYLCFASLVIFLTPQISILFKSTDKLSLKEDEKKSLWKIVEVDVTDLHHYIYRAYYTRIKCKIKN